MGWDEGNLIGYHRDDALLLPLANELGVTLPRIVVVSHKLQLASETRTPGGSTEW